MVILQPAYWKLPVTYIQTQNDLSSSLQFFSICVFFLTSFRCFCFGPNHNRNRKCNTFWWVAQGSRWLAPWRTPWMDPDSWLDRLKMLLILNHDGCMLWLRPSDLSVSLRIICSTFRLQVQSLGQALVGRGRLSVSALNHQRTHLQIFVGLQAVVQLLG